MKNIAIVGCGPRGLAALEAFLSQVRSNNELLDFKIHIFDDAEYLGAGAVWNPTQSDANWINISLRALSELKGREPLIIKNVQIPSFPKFTVWLEKNYGSINSSLQDKFPRRSTMGTFLNARFQSLITAFKGSDMLEVLTTAVTDVSIEDESIILQTANNSVYKMDECLLTVGHQKTVLDDQMQEWVEHAAKHEITVFTHPYQDGILDPINPESVVGVRGLGLSTIDVLRKITLELGGEFEEQDDTPFLRFQSSPKCPSKIVPFSLDGLVCAPKPLNMKIDHFFKPSKEESKEFEELLTFQLNKNLDKMSSKILIEIFAKNFTDKFSDHFDIEKNNLERLVQDWIADPSIKHHTILETDLSVKNYMMALAKMAIGIEKPSLDYTIGQYWRWLQPIMYAIFSHSALSDEKMADIVKVDEQTKRYSYGPPVESILQLIALAEDGILDLGYANNPEISLSSAGWTLSLSDEEITCDVMIDSVLSPPKVTAIESGPIKCLIENEQLELVSSDLGFSTSKDGTVIGKHKNYTHLSVLGRLAKGSVLGVDAILECFGPRIDDWAIGLCNRLRNVN